MKNIFSIIATTVCLNTYAQICFTSVNYPVLNGGTSIACNDFNSDGKLDLIVGYSGQPIYLLLGDGLGSFGTGNIVYEDSSISPPILWRYFISGDFNMDGNSDLAIASIVFGPIDDSLKILFGDGTGHFQTSASFAVDYNPNSICSADFNRDGNIDLATANDSSVSVLLGDGTGGFSNHVDLNVGVGTDLNAITSGDFNGDGKADLSVTCNGSDPDSLWVSVGDGTGNFGTAKKYLVGSGPYSVCSKDFNEDGYDDIAVANSNSDNVSILLSKGVSGTFFDAINYPASPGTNYDPFSVVSEDFNLDGHYDLAVADHYHYVYILIGTGTGSFNSSTYYPALYGPWTIISADFNSDGKPDLATANQSSEDITVFLNCATQGIDYLNYKQDVSMYPNPTTGNFFIETTLTGKLSVQIFDLAGKMVLNQNINDKTNIDATCLSAGIYNLAIKSNTGILNKKLVIIR